MKSTEVYRALRVHLAPVFRAAGFKRAKGLLSWARPQANGSLVVWCQVSIDGWDAYAGSRFTVDFQLSDEPTAGARSTHRLRFPKLLDDRGREQIRAIQNRVIASLRHPPVNHPTLQISEEIRGWYLAKFREVAHPYSDRDDIWLRYCDEGHVDAWAQFIISKLPACLEQTDTWG